jgi:hypothetical protein
MDPFNPEVGLTAVRCWRATGPVDAYLAAVYARRGREKSLSIASVRAGVTRG